MPFSVDSLLTDTDWIPMSLKGQQESPTYYWEDGGLLKDAPVRSEEHTSELQSP